LTEPPPDHAFEITEGFLAGASPRHPGPPKQEALGERGLTASPSAPNLIKPQAYRDLLPRVAESLNPRRNGTAVIIPDYAVRMAILDFEELPAGESERAALVRFRLRKSVPFPIDEAQVSYSIQSSEPERIEVLAVAIARPILEEYESVFTLAGYRVGLVMPSSLAALPLCQAGGDGFTVLAKAAESTLTVLLLDRGRVRLVRCIDLAGEMETGRQSSQVTLASLQQTVAYAEDQFSQRVKQVVLCGFGVETDTVGQTVERELRIPYQAARSRFGWPSRQNAGLMGLLEQYAA